MTMLAGNNRFDFDVVGESYYQEEIEAICGPKCKAGYRLGIDAVLHPEPDNPYDANAVAVLIEGDKVASLSRQDAVRFRADARALGLAGRDLDCMAMIVGGWSADHEDDEGSFGVKLDLEWPLRVEGEAAARTPAYVHPAFKAEAPGWGVARTVGVLALLLVGALILTNAIKPAPPVPHIQTEAEKDELRVTGAKALVLKTLKDPDSANFTYAQVSRKSGAPVVCGYVNAKNSFGGYVGDKAFIATDAGVLTLPKTTTRAFRKRWDASC